MSMYASLVFEQSYGGSKAKALRPPSCMPCCSLSPRYRCAGAFAGTGSVNQHALVQAIGGAKTR